MKTLSILIKPSSSLCNMRCKYCFYCDEAEHRSDYSMGMMSAETLELLVRRAMEESVEAVSFAFQGGEPTLCGLAFYQNFVRILAQYRRPEVKIFLSIQTNGLLIDGEWAEFFRKNHFLVGISLDGGQKLHDGNRIDPDGKGTYIKVKKAISLLEKNHVAYNILTVVTNQLARHIQSVYENYKKEGFRHLQFIPCIAGLDAVGEDMELSLTPKRYAAFLKTLFDLWYRDYRNGSYISIRHFDNWVLMLAGAEAETCAMSGKCSPYFVVEGDGSVYPCDFYVLDEWKLGNLAESSFTDLLESPLHQAFLEQSIPKPEQCRQCPFLYLCRGGCRRDRDIGGTLGKNRFCSSYYDFFQEKIPAVQVLAEEQRNFMRR